MVIPVSDLGSAPSQMLAQSGDVQESVGVVVRTKRTLRLRSGPEESLGVRDGAARRSPAPSRRTIHESDVCVRY